jgi:hypothetical protein
VRIIVSRGATSDPEQRLDMLQFAQMWMSLTKPIGDLLPAKSPYEIYCAIEKALPGS